MKTKNILTFLLLIFISFGYSQKKELRNANKFYDSGEYLSALDLLETSKSLFDSSDDKIKSQVMLLYGKIYTSTEDFELAIKSFNNSRELGANENDLNFEINKLETAIITSAIADNESENFSDAAKKLKIVYDINPENNALYLYYAASSAVNSNDLSLALEYYLILRDIKYEGIETKYYITDVSNETEIEISSETEFNLLKKSKDYSNPREEETESKFPEIVKNIAIIYKQLGQNDMALAAIETARAPAEQQVLPATDILFIPGVTSFVPIFWPILALIVTVVIHEYGHGLQARAHGMRIRSFGVLIAGIIPVGAFYEPEQEEIRIAPSRERLRLFAAGPSINIVLTYILVVLLAGASHAEY